MKSFLLKSLLLAGLAFSLNAVPAAAQQLPQLEWVGKMEEITTIVKSTVNSSGDVFTSGAFNDNPDFNIDTNPSETFTLQRWYAGGFICKTLANGHFAWARGYGPGQGSSSFAEIAPPVTDRSGNIYMFIIGNTNSHSNSNKFCLDYGTGVIDTLSLPTTSFGSSSSSEYILKFNAQGQRIWMKRVCSGAVSGAYYKAAAIIDDYGDIYITSLFSDTVIFSPGGVANTLVLPANQSGVFLCKLDSAGNVLWNRSILASENSFSVGLKMGTDGKNALFISGDFRQTMDFDPGPGTAVLNPDSVGTIYVDKLDLNGNFLKAFGTGRKADGITGITLQAMAVDVSGNSYLTGIFGGHMDFDPSPDSLILSAPAPMNSVFVTKFNADGSLEWAKPLYKVHNFYSSSEVITSNDIAVDAKGNVFLTGGFSGIVDFDPGPDSFNLSNGGMDNTVFVCKLEASGDLGWAFAMDHQGYGGFGASIDVTDSGDIYTTGFFGFDTMDFDPGPGTLNLSPNLYTAAFIQKLKDNTSTGIGNLSGNESSPSVQLYPNPAGNELWLKSNGKAQVKTVLVYNMLGQELRREKASSGSLYRLDVRSLAPGFYVLKALLADGQVAQGKFEVRRKAVGE